MIEAFKKGATGPLALAGVGFCGMSIIIIAYRWGWQPYAKKQRMAQSEEFANYIYQQRQKRSMEEEQQKSSAF